MNIFKKIALLATIVAISACGTGTGEENGIRPVTSSSSKYISKVNTYHPAAGQFINDSFSGDDKAANSIIGGTDGLLSMGAFGGYVVFMFDHTVLNIDGADFTVCANAFDNSSEPGIVMVSFDGNGNGLPDDVWYELAAEDYATRKSLKDCRMTYARPKSMTELLSVSWSDNYGNRGEIKPNQFNQGHSYFPNWASDMTHIEFIGTRIEARTTVNGIGANGYKPHPSGYVDNYSSEYTMESGNLFDISRAIDSDGNFIKLKGVDFIKIYTAVQYAYDDIGEASTEIRGAISLSVK